MVDTLTDLMRAIDHRVDNGITHARDRQSLTPATVKAITYAGVDVRVRGSYKYIRNLEMPANESYVVGDTVMLVRAGSQGWSILGGLKRPTTDSGTSTSSGGNVDPSSLIDEAAGLTVYNDLIQIDLQASGGLAFDVAGDLGVDATELDHGDLLGLGDDDHTQYLNIGRHDTTSRHGTGVVNHGLIDGLGDDDHPQYGALAQNEVVTGAWDFQASLNTRSIIPGATDTYDLGSATVLWRQAWISELQSILFVENTIQALGGWFLVPHGQGTLGEDVDATETQIDFGTSLSTNDFILLRGNGQVEYMQVGTLVSGTNYNVTRNVDGSGANTWPKGHVWINLGYNGDGRIELDAQTGGPRISIVSQGTSYNAQSEYIRLGDLNGWGDYGAGDYGLAVGDPNMVGGVLTYDPANGLHVYGTSTNMLNNPSISGHMGGWFNTGGTIAIANDLTKDGYAVQTVNLTSDGNFYFATRNIEIDPRQSYIVSLSLYSAHADATGTRYVGIIGYDASGAVVDLGRFDLASRTVTGDVTYPYFWYGNLYGGTWRDITGYIAGTGVDPDTIPEMQNTTWAIQLKPNVTHIALRILNFYNGGTSVRNDIYSPSLTPVIAARIHGDLVVDGSIVSDHLAANSVTADKINVTNLAAVNASTGNLTVTGNLTLSGGTFRTAASPAARVEMSGSLLAGYSSGTTKQFWISATDGKAYAANGKIALDSSGIQLVRNAGSEYDAGKSIKFVESIGGAARGLIGHSMNSDGFGDWNRLWIKAEPRSGYTSRIVLDAEPAPGEDGEMGFYIGDTSVQFKDNGGSTPTFELTSGYFVSHSAKRARYSHGADQSLPTEGVAYRLTFNSTAKNVGGFYRSDSNRRIHLPEVGTYYVNFLILASRPQAGGTYDHVRVDTQIRLNGSVVMRDLASCYVPASQTEYLACKVACWVHGAAGDYIEIAAIRYGGTSGLNLYGGYTWNNLYIHKVN